MKWERPKISDLYLSKCLCDFTSNDKSFCSNRDLQHPPYKSALIQKTEMYTEHPKTKQHFWQKWKLSIWMKYHSNKLVQWTVPKNSHGLNNISIWKQSTQFHKDHLLRNNLFWQRRCVKQRFTCTVNCLTGKETIVVSPYHNTITECHEGALVLQTKFAKKKKSHVYL